MISKKYIKDLGFDIDQLDLFFDYIYELHTNGNYTEVKEYILKLSNSQFLDFLKYVLIYNNNSYCNFIIYSLQLRLLK